MISYDDLAQGPDDLIPGYGADQSDPERLGRRMRILMDLYPELTDEPDALTSLAATPYDDEQMVRHVREAFASTNWATEAQDLAVLPQAMQRGRWERYSPDAQAQLKATGYQVPDAPSSDGPSLPIIGPALGLAGDVAGGFVDRTQDVLGDTLGALIKIGDFPAHLVRTAERGAEIEGAADDAWGFSWDMLNPTKWDDIWGRAWAETANGNRYFPEYGRERARAALRRLDLGDVDPSSAFDFAIEIAGGTSLEDLAVRAGAPGSEAYQSTYLAMSRLSQDKRFVKVVENLQNDRFTVGRHIMRNMGFEPGDDGFGVASGLLDAAWVIGADPLLMGGKLLKARRALQTGLAIGHLDEAALVGRVRAVYEGEHTFGGSTAQRIIGAGRNGVKEAFDDVARIWSSEDRHLLYRRYPMLGGLNDALLHFDKTHGLKSGADLATFFEDSRSYALLMEGRLGGWRGQTLLPSLKGMAPFKMQTKEFLDKAIHYGADKAIDARRAARTTGGYSWNAMPMWYKDGNPSAFVNLNPLTGFAHWMEGFLRHAPRGAKIELFGDDALGEIERFTNLGLFADVPWRVRKLWINDMLASGDSGRFAIAKRVTEEIIDALPVSDASQVTALRNKFVTNAAHAYSMVRELDVAGELVARDLGNVPGVGKVALYPLVQGAHAIALPDPTELLKQADRTTMMRSLFGWTNSGMTDMFMRAWRPAVLLRLAFIPRAFGEELLSYMLRYPTGLVRSVLGRTVGAPDIDSIAKKASDSLVKRNHFLTNASGQSVQHLTPDDLNHAWDQLAGKLIDRWDSPGPGFTYHAPTFQMFIDGVAPDLPEILRAMDPFDLQMLWAHKTHQPQSLLGPLAWLGRRSQAIGFSWDEALEQRTKELIASGVSEGKARGQAKKWVTEMAGEHSFFARPNRLAHSIMERVGPHMNPADLRYTNDGALAADLAFRDVLFTFSEGVRDSLRRRVGPQFLTAARLVMDDEAWKSFHRNASSANHSLWAGRAPERQSVFMKQNGELQEVAHVVIAGEYGVSDKADDFFLTRYLDSARSALDEPAVQHGARAASRQVNHSTITFLNGMTHEALAPGPLDATLTAAARRAVVTHGESAEDLGLALTTLTRTARELDHYGLYDEVLNALSRADDPVAWHRIELVIADSREQMLTRGADVSHLDAFARRLALLREAPARVRYEMTARLGEIRWHVIAAGSNNPERRERGAKALAEWADGLFTDPAERVAKFTQATRESLSSPEYGKAVRNVLRSRYGSVSGRPILDHPQPGFGRIYTPYVSIEEAERITAYILAQQTDANLWRTTAERLDEFIAIAREYGQARFPLGVVAHSDPTVATDWYRTMRRSLALPDEQIELGFLDLPDEELVARHYPWQTRIQASKDPVWGTFLPREYRLGSEHAWRFEPLRPAGADRITFEGGLDEWASVLALDFDYLFTDRNNNEVMYELFGPMLRDAEQPMFSLTGTRHRVTPEHVLLIPGDDLPPLVRGKEFALQPNGMWSKIMRFGFEGVLGPAIDALGRKPMWWGQVFEGAVRAANHTWWARDPELYGERLPRPETVWDVEGVITHHARPAMPVAEQHAMLRDPMLRDAVILSNPSPELRASLDEVLGEGSSILDDAGRVAIGDDGVLRSADGATLIPPAEEVLRSLDEPMETAHILDSAGAEMRARAYREMHDPANHGEFRLRVDLADDTPLAEEEIRSEAFANWLREHDPDVLDAFGDGERIAEDAVEEVANMVMRGDVRPPLWIDRSHTFRAGARDLSSERVTLVPLTPAIAPPGNGGTWVFRGVSDADQAFVDELGNLHLLSGPGGAEVHRSFLRTGFGEEEEGLRFGEHMFFSHDPALAMRYGTGDVLFQVDEDVLIRRYDLDLDATRNAQELPGRHGARAHDVPRPEIREDLGAAATAELIIADAPEIVIPAGRWRGFHPAAHGGQTTSAAEMEARSLASWQTRIGTPTIGAASHRLGNYPSSVALSLSREATGSLNALKARLRAVSTGQVDLGYDAAEQATEMLVALDRVAMGPATVPSAPTLGRVTSRPHRMVVKREGALHAVTRQRGRSYANAAYKALPEGAARREVHAALREATGGATSAAKSWAMVVTDESARKRFLWHLKRRSTPNTYDRVAASVEDVARWQDVDTLVDSYTRAPEIVKTIRSREQFDDVVERLHTGRLAMPVPDWFEHITYEDLELLQAAEVNAMHTAQAIKDSALQYAANTIGPFIDDMEIRSLWQSQVRNVIPFYYAEALFLKRWARTLVHSPEAIRRAQLAYHGLQTTGVIQQNSNGEDIVVYPGSPALTELLTRTLGKIPLVNQVFGDDATLPLASVLTGQVRNMLPGTDRLALPSFAPTVAVPVSWLGQRFPEIGAVEEDLLGSRGTGRGALRMVVPTHLMRFYDAILGNADSSAQVASAMNKSLIALDYAGLTPDERSTVQQRQEYLDRVENQSRIILLAKAMFGFVVPASPSETIVSGSSFDPGLNLGTEALRSNLSPEYLTLVRNLGYDVGTTEFLRLHPDATAYTVFATDRPSGAPLPSTTDAVRFLDNHGEWLKQFPHAGGWMLPLAKATDPYSRKAYNAQVAHELRLRKAPAEFLDDLYFGAAAEVYFTSQDNKQSELERLANDPGGRQDLEARWSAWSRSYKNMHPVFASILADPSGRERRTNVVAELELALADPARPEFPHADKLSQMVRSLRNFQLTMDQLYGDSSARAEDARARVEAEFSDWGERMVLSEPGLLPFWRGVVVPVAGLDYWEED